MANEIEGKLVAELLAANSEQKIKELLAEIRENNNPIFCYPIYEVYKKIKNEAYSHYALVALRDIDSPEVINIALEIGNDKDSTITDLNYVIEIFIKRSFYNPIGVQIGKDYINRLEKNDYCYLYDLDNICTYLKTAGELSILNSKMPSFYQNNNFDTDTRIYAMNYYLEIDPSNRIQELINDYDEIKKDETLEKIVAKVSIKWKGTKTDELRTLIKKGGSIRAKHIIDRYEKKIIKESKKTKNIEQAITKKKYSNAELISKIIKNREQINITAKGRKNIGFFIFPQNESIFKQLIAASDEPTFVNACNELRPFISNISEELKKVAIGHTNEQIQKLLPTTSPSDYNKPINKLFLFLLSKKYKVNDDLFGLRHLNRIFSLAMHPEEKNELIKELKKVGLNKLYENQEYGLLHQSLLENYLSILQDITNLINSISD